VSQKILPPKVFWQYLPNDSEFLYKILHAHCIFHICAKLQFFQLSLTRTKLYHIKGYQFLSSSDFFTFHEKNAKKCHISLVLQHDRSLYNRRQFGEDRGASPNQYFTCGYPPCRLQYLTVVLFYMVNSHHNK